jgi:biopolymer transport protein TolR
VMLVLVVILIITAPLLASSIRLDLPDTDAGQPSDAPRFVTVAVERSGRVFFNDKPVDAAQLAERLAQAANQSKDTEVQLRADQDVPYGRVVEIMGAAHKAGLNRIGFVAEPPKK